MTELYGSDAYAPREIAQRVESVGVAKARLETLPLLMLGVLAGAFIGLGALFFVLVKSDATLSWAVSQVLGGVVFSLGLLLVVVAGAELFTGNNLLAMAWADGKITSAEVLRNWVLVCVANFVGAAGLAVLVFLSGHPDLNGGAIGRTVVKIALAKQDLSFSQAFFRGVLCNVLVCMAVWMAMGGRSVVDKAVAIVFPVSAFVAAGFEHSIANMYFMPLAMMVQQSGAGPAGLDAVTWGGMAANFAAVIAGNLVGGSVLVGLTYHVIYRRGPPTASAGGRAGSAPAQQRCGAQHGKHRGRHPVHDWQGYQLRDFLAEPDHRRIGNHHAESGAGDDPEPCVILRGQHDGGNLGLVAHLREKEGDHRGTEDAEARVLAIVVILIQFVGYQHPGRHGQEGDPEHPAQHVRAEHGRHPGAQGTRQRVVGNRGHENAPDDGPGPAKTRREDKRQQLRLVAHFSEGDDAGGDEKGFHEVVGPGRTIANNR